MIYKLLDGKRLVIDTEDYDLVVSLNVYPSTQPNGNTYIQYWDGTKSMYLHRLLSKAKRGQYTDHKNGITLDNRKSNLQNITHAQNMQKMKNQKNTTGYRGVYFDRRGRKSPYRTEVQRFGKRTHLGSYRTAKEAAEVRDKWVRCNYPEFAVYNFDDIV